MKSGYTGHPDVAYSLLTVMCRMFSGSESSDRFSTVRCGVVLLQYHSMVGYSVDVWSRNLWIPMEAHVVPTLEKKLLFVYIIVFGFSSFHDKGVYNQRI